MKHIQQEQIEADLGSAPFENGRRVVRYALAEGEHLTQRFTTSNPDGRSVAGPATVTITEWADGGIDIQVR